MDSLFPTERTHVLSTSTVGTATEEFSDGEVDLTIERPDGGIAVLLSRITISGQPLRLRDLPQGFPRRLMKAVERLRHIDSAQVTRRISEGGTKEFWLEFKPHSKKGMNSRQMEKNVEKTLRLIATKIERSHCADSRTQSKQPQAFVNRAPYKAVLAS